MTTDNRTNEPTEAQVGAAAKAMWDLRKLSGDPEWDVLEYGVKNEYRKDARAALVAAQGAAPQAPVLSWSEHECIKDCPEVHYCAVHGDLLAGTRSWRCNHAAPGHESAPVLPSSGVDEDALVQRIYDELMTDDAVAEVWSNGKVMATARRIVKFAVQGGREPWRVR